MPNGLLLLEREAVAFDFLFVFTVPIAESGFLLVDAAFLSVNSVDGLCIFVTNSY